ncbi:hypothetical protein F2Q69_00035659 [Brassica cretica]|uniref:Uncharacterized protein n=1 Tax=Brassica cretica TaxID=69181 RepID=A0A8S9SVF5_BRACR|nr:hypothetical protein F2Q69_00035659 [Brassica cretica]
MSNLSTEDDTKEDTAPKSLPSNQRQSTRRRRLRFEKIYGKVPLKVHTTIRFPDENPYNLRVPGLRSMQAIGSLNKVHPASGVLDESLYNLRSHPRTYGFQKDVSLNLQILGEHAQDPLGSMKARRKVIPTLMVAYLRGADCGTTLLRVAKNQWQSSTNVSTSLFGMETTARLKQHVQEIYSSTKNQLGYLQAPRRTC